MNKNLLIAGIIIILVIIGAILLFSGPSTPSEQPAPNGNGAPPPVQASAPTVQTTEDSTPSNSTAVVNGRVTPNGAPTEYWFEYGPSTSLGSKTANQSVGSGHVAIAAPGFITGLQANTRYYFRLAAQNSAGLSHGATFSFVTTSDNPPPRTDAPSAQTLAATNLERTGATLNGRVDPNDSQTEYWFEYGTDQSMGNTTNFRSAGSGDASNNVAISVSGLEANTTYFFRLNAQNQFGTVNGSIMSFTTPGPPTPSSPTATTTNATNAASSSATIHGQVNAKGTATEYWFEYSSDTLLGGIVGNATTKQPAGSGQGNVNVSANLNNLSPNTKYFYRVVAENQSGTVRGEERSFTTTDN